MHEPLPTFVPPMLLTAGTVPDGEAWALELKWDGCRAQLRYDGCAVTLRTRNGRECSDDFPELLGIANALGKRHVILDGELVRLRSDGRPDFARLRHRLKGSRVNRRPVVLQVFDVLHLEGRSTRALPTGSAGRFSRSSRSTGPAGVPPRASSASGRSYSS